MKAKRTIAAVMACTMLAASAVPLQATAADATVKLSGAKVEAAAGAEFSVDVSLTDIPASKINVLDFGMKFDASALNVTEVVIGPSADTKPDDATASEAPIFATSVKDGQIAISWTTAASSDAWIATDGVILTVKGTVNADAKDGTYPLEFVPVDRTLHNKTEEVNKDILISYVYGNDSAEYKVETDNGAVIVGTPEETTTPAETTAPAETTTAPATTEQTTTAPAGTTKSEETTTREPIVIGDALYGDVNIDGKVELVDAILLNKACAGQVTLTDEARVNADCNADGGVSTDDAIALLRFLVHLATELPVVD